MRPSNDSNGRWHRLNPPKKVLGVKVTRVIDTWWVDDIWGSRYYCKVKTKDGREVILLKIEKQWQPVFVI